jgi:hypothetical protein
LTPAKLALLVVVGLLLFAGAAQAQDVYVKSRTSAVTSTMLSNRLVGLRVGLADLRRWWGGDCYLKLGKAPAGAWQISISPPESVFYSGYHSYGPFGPYARVFTDGNDSWTIPLTHELFEMCTDPYLVRTVQSDKLYLVEVCDPVEAFSYARRGVPISDFVGPDWYSGGNYFDKMGLVQQAHQLLSGGFYSYWDGYDWLYEDAP